MEELFEGAIWTEDADEVPHELRGIIHYSSSNGKLYIAADDGQIRCAEVRQQLLSGVWAAPSAANSAAPCAPPTVSSMQPAPELDLTITSFALNRTATHAIAAGPTLTDPEISACFILDLAGRHPLPGDKNAAELPASPLDEGLFSSHPGLRILQVTWHPHSDRHVAILTSDATWRLYDISSPDLAEQIFELQTQSGKIGLGLGGESLVASPVAFSFGKGTGWDSFAVYFLSQNGGVSVLCPIAPFGARYPSRTIETLQDSLDNSALFDTDAAENAQAWLQRAFQPVGSYLSPSSESLLSLQACRPHALDEHSPVLVGPISVATADGSAQKSLVPAPAEDLLMWRFGGACTTVAIASAQGPVAVHILSNSAVPKWQNSPPQCVVEGTDLKAVRNQSAPLHSGTMRNPAQHAQHQLILVDYVSLQPPLTDSDDGNDSEEELGLASSSLARTPGSKRAMLQLDLASADTVYCVYPGQSYAITLPYLSVLAEHLSSQDAAGLPDVLPCATAEELSGGKAAAVAAVAVGDALCSSGLVILYSDGSTKCLRPSGPGVAISSGGVGDDAGGAARSKAEADIESQIQSIYGELLKVPNAGAIPSVGASELGSPAGTKALADAVAALRRSHIEFAHRAHHDLLERLEQLKSEVQSQEERAAKVAALAEQAEGQRGKLEARVREASWMAENISRRLHILAELHWALPRPASVAELAFKRDELPALEEAARRLTTEVGGVSGRVGALQRGLKPLSNAAAAMAVTNKGAGSASSLPHAQLRQVRELLAEHDRAIRAAKAQAAMLEEALSAAAVGA